MEILPTPNAAGRLTDTFQLRRIKQFRAVDTRAARASARSIAPLPAANPVRQNANQGLRLRCSDWCQVRTRHWRRTNTPQRSVERCDRDLRRGRDLYTYCAAPSREVNDEAGRHPARSRTPVSRPARKIEVRSQRAALPVRDFEVRSIRGGHGDTG